MKYHRKEENIYKDYGVARNEITNAIVHESTFHQGCKLHLADDDDSSDTHHENLDDGDGGHGHSHRQTRSFNPEKLLIINHEGTFHYIWSFIHLHACFSSYMYAYWACFGLDFVEWEKHPR